MNGADELGYAYMLRALKMADQVRLLDSLNRTKDRANKARVFTSWALFGWQALVAYMQQAAPLWATPPSIPLPDSTKFSEWYGELYFRFPSSSTIHASHLAHYTESKWRLWSIANNVAIELGNKNLNQKGLSFSRVVKLYTRLREWYEVLPDSLRPERIVTPYQIQLHMQYYSIMINLLEEPTPTESKDPKNTILTAETFPEAPRMLLADSKRRFETLVRIYYLRHGFENLDAFMIQYLSLLAFLTLPKILANNEDIPLATLQSSIVLAAVGLADQSRSHYIGYMAYSAVRGKMGAGEVELIDRYTAQGRVSGSHPPKDWRANSIWPMDFGNRAVSAEERVLAKLLEEATIRDAQKGDESSV